MHLLAPLVFAGLSCVYLVFETLVAVVALGLTVDLAIGRAELLSRKVLIGF